jgi:hypothetical protein
MELTDLEQENLNKVKDGLLSDSKISPFLTKEWRKKFVQDNPDGIRLKDAPIDKYLIVLEDSLGTLYQNSRGTALSRGSVIVKLSDTELLCYDGTYWYATHDGKAIIFQQHGNFEIGVNCYGLVKLLRDITI